MTISDHPAWDPILNLKQGAAYINRSTDFLGELVRNRVIKCVRSSQAKGSPIGIRLSTLNAWIEKNTVQPLRAR